MIDYQPLFAQLGTVNLSDWPRLPAQLAHVFDSGRYGDLPTWRDALRALPRWPTDHVQLDADVVSIGLASEITTAQRAALEQQLQLLHPWRKGPFSVFGLHIDTEWRSDWKWRRLADQLTPLAGRRVLDIGCGSGYHLWRMLGAGAEFVLGIDPSPLYVHQFYAIKHFAGERNAHLLPLGIEHLPENRRGFDTVFSMGVLYHRRSPIDHLLELQGCLQSGGELVLETLVIDDAEGDVLVPEARYAKMRNVWFIPSIELLTRWLQRTGYRNIRVVDINVTTLEEQRSTAWMRFESLADFLDPLDRHRTVEGYPAPRRAVVLAEAP
ncbi:MAG: tRNA 5-methoxyuridine(34)/uridine 5-oxyacetic acid(34) synthase CmoB [Gammaproteobacteria bacterium]